MAREDKGSAIGSDQDNASGKSGDQESGSLAARRARLRGSLSKQITPPDPYQPSPSEAVGDLDKEQGSDKTKASDAPKNGSAPIADPGPEQVYKASSAPEQVEKSDEVSELAQAQPESAATLPVSSEESPVSESPSSTATKASPAKKMDFDTSALFNSEDKAASKSAPPAAESALPASPVHVPAPVVNIDTSQIVELINNVDQQLGICSVNLSQIAKAANEQLELVRNLAETIQHQAFGEIGLSLNSLSESMSAALEPMKAVGELVPAIDNLVVTISNKEEPKKAEPAMTPEALVTSLADQLSAGLIEPWTFKCAYMAVFPSEHPADLLRKLVDLLGTQRLSGDLFRAAYDAVQAAEPPKPVAAYSAPAGGGGEVRYVQDEAVLAQLDELKRANDELKGRMDQREIEFAEMLQSKEIEVSETQEMLNSRWDEFSGRYEQLSEMLRERNEQIQAKEGELARIQAEKESELARIQADRDIEMARMAGEVSNKDTEIGVLKNQLEEMRDQTKDMVADLQRQLTSTKLAVEEAAKKEPPKPQPGFFESAAAAAATMPAPAQPASNAQLFNPEPQAQPQQLFSPPADPVNSIGSVAQTLAPTPDPVVPSPQPAPASVPGGMPAAPVQPVGAGASANAQAIPRPQVAAPTTPFPGSPGSYGSGVRAQVFEVIVRQALAGAPWREICAGPMQVNSISPDEVEAEVKRRQALLKK